MMPSTTYKLKVFMHVLAVAPAGAGLPGHCPGISAHYIYHVIRLNVLRARACIHRVRIRDVAYACGHGLRRSRVNLESV